MTSGSKTISLQVEGAQDSERGVKYPNETICAVSTFSVSIPCYYYYPRQNNQVTQMLWCALQSNTHCQESLYVYNSSSSSITDFKYIGDNKSDCTLLIHNVQFSYSGKYKFNFITNVTDGGEVNNPGVTVQFTDLKVSLIRLSGNGTLKPGDSLNLTCDVTCTQSSSQFVWSKNNELLPESGAVLHFPALTLRDSGKYTCIWKTNTTSGSKTISLQVEGEDQWNIWIIVLVTVGVILISLVAGAVILYKRFVHTEQQMEDESNIYANVQPVKDTCNIYANVQPVKDTCNIYANVQPVKDTCNIDANVQPVKDTCNIYANV
ncbi:uncharacterized protein LOC124403801 isoform X2 [Silurus meridionalis]|uniref:uncharacterized protein LOC124403801 isoform X2 n=1 Tax=Silurus meridionalis TaxID=175797 RepID=UPI001EEC8CC0|nr:uncharacterized protein LOC124403801 isoform X2 [Silurus meridionalis]